MCVCVGLVSVHQALSEQGGDWLRDTERERGTCVCVWSVFVHQALSEQRGDVLELLLGLVDVGVQEHHLLEVTAGRQVVLTTTRTDRQTDRQMDVSGHT